MIDSTPLPVVVDQGPAGTTQSVVETDAGGETQEALQYTLFESRQSACSVTFQGEDVLAGVENGLDSLAERSQMRTFSGLVFSLGPHHGSLKVVGGRSELLARVPLVGKEDLPSLASAPAEEVEPHLPLIPFGRAEQIGAGSAVDGKDTVQTHPPEVAGVRGAVAVIANVSKSGAECRLPASPTFDRGGVNKQKVVVETGALLTKEDEQPPKDRGETAPALEVASLSGDTGKQMRKRSLCPSKETPVGGLTHDGLGHRQGDDLGVGRAPTGVGPSFWQKIIGCAINECAEGVEVGAHRGLLVDGVLDTVDFGPSASNPFCTGIFVESII
jgi:hypothetical protein